MHDDSFWEQSLKGFRRYTRRILANSGDISWCVQYSPEKIRDRCMHNHDRKKYNSSSYLSRKSKDKHYFSHIIVKIKTSVPDRAKLDRAKPLLRIPTTSHGSSPRSTDESVMQSAGARKPILWQIFRTWTTGGPAEKHEEPNHEYAHIIIRELMTIWCLVRTLVVSTPFTIKLSANCDAKLETKTEASGGRIDTWQLIHNSLKNIPSIGTNNTLSSSDAINKLSSQCIYIHLEPNGQHAHI